MVEFISQCMAEILVVDVPGLVTEAVNVNRTCSDHMRMYVYESPVLSVKGDINYVQTSLFPQAISLYGGRT